MSDIRVVVRSEGFAVAAWREVGVGLWTGDATVERVEAMGRALNEGLAGLDATALLTIIEAQAPVPPPESRAALAEQMREAGSRVRVSGVVYEGVGFRAAMVRSVVTGMSLLARQPFPHRVFPAVADAAAWMAPQLPQGALGGAKLAGIVGELRERAARNA